MKGKVLLLNKKELTMFINTAIYVRVSTEEQATEGFSIHAQKDKLTKHVEVSDYNIVDYYIDDGISGKNLKERPEVTRLINDVKSGLSFKFLPLIPSSI